MLSVDLANELTGMRVRNISRDSTSSAGAVVLPIVNQFREQGEDPMSSGTQIRSFQVDMPDEVIADLRRRIAATYWPSQELVADGSQGVQLATMQELARYWATDYDWRACVRGEAERAAAVQDRNRRGRHPFHPRQVPARKRAAADHHARLARFGDRAARGRRPAHRPDRARRLRRRRVQPGTALPARLRLLGRAGRGRLGPRPRRAGLGGAR